MENTVTYKEKYANTTESVLAEIQQERIRQYVKFGFQDIPPSHFALILGEEVGEVNKEIIDSHFMGLDVSNVTDLRKEIIQTAAVCVQFLQWIDLQTKPIQEVASE